MTQEQNIKEYERECGHVEMLHWKECAECREYMVRKGLRQQILEAVEREIDGMSRWFFDDVSNHEFIDTCDLYKMLQKYKKNQ